MNSLQVLQRLHELSRTVSCDRPWCRAEPGESCKTRNGARASRSHDNRYRSEHYDQVRHEQDVETRLKLLRGG